jgi:hypothetical protein
LFLNGSSRGEAGQGEGGRRRAALALGVLLATLLIGTGAVTGRIAYAQTPTTPPADPGQQSGQAPSQEQAQQPPAQPAPTEPPVPLQQFQIQQPGRLPAIPGIPPSTTIPPWTPPVPPAPSQTNVPAPFPYATPGTPGIAPGTPGYVGGIPNLSIPGAFSGARTTLRGALLEFHPTARAALEYSDNFFQTTNRSDENFRSILGPGFTLLLNGARTFGTLTTVVDLVHDTAPNTGDDVKVFPSLSAALRYALSPRLSLTLTEAFLRNDQASTADQFGIRSGRQTYETNTLGLAVDWILDRIAAQAYYRNVLFFNENSSQNGTNATNQDDTVTNILGVNGTVRIATDYLVRAGYEFSRSDNLNGSSNSNDTTSHTVFGSVSRQFGLYTTAGLSTSFQQQSDENTRIYNASLFGAYGLPTGLSLAASVGYSILDSDSNNEGTISASLNASYRFARAVISVGVLQDFHQTAQQGQNFGTVESRTYFGSFLYQLTPFINTVLHASYSENSPTGTGNNENSGTQTQLTYGASLNWQVLRWLTASLQYTFTKETGQNSFNQGSTTGSGEFKENRASLSLFAIF